MAITLRNKRVEAKIKAIGRRTGEGPSAVIARLVEAEQPETGLVSPDEAARRDAEWDAYIATRPPWTAEQLVLAKAVEEDMYDDDGLPKSGPETFTFE